MDTRSTQPDKFGWDDERISAYLDGELTAPEQTQFEKELAQSSELNQLVEELRIVRQQLEQLPQHKLESDFAANVLIRAAHEILADSQLRSQALHSEHCSSNGNNIENANIENGSVHKSTSVASTGMTKSSANNSSRNIRPLIWSVVALAAGLMLLVTNSKNLTEREESIAAITSNQPRAMHEKQWAFDKSSHDVEDLKKSGDLAKLSKGTPEPTNLFSESQPPANTPLTKDAARSDSGSFSDLSGNTLSDNVAPLPRASDRSEKSGIMQKDGSERFANDALTTPIAKAPESAAGFGGQGIATPPLAQSEPIATLPKIAMKGTGGPANEGDSGRRGGQNDFDLSKSSSEFIAPLVAPVNEEFYVVQFSCPPTTIQNKSFDKLLRDNRIEIKNEPMAFNDSKAASESVTKAEDKSTSQKSNSAPLLKAPAREKSEEQLVQKKIGPKDEEKLASKVNESDRRFETAKNEKDVEVVMIEMDRSQFDRLMNDVCNKTEEYSNVQIAQAPAQLQLDLLNKNLALTSRFNAPSQAAANPFGDINGKNSDTYGLNSNKESPRDTELNFAKKQADKPAEAPPAGYIAKNPSQATPAASTPNQNGANQSPPPFNAYDPASGASANNSSLNGSLSNSQSSGAYPPAPANQQSNAPNTQNFSYNGQLSQSGAAQRLEFSDVDNKSVSNLGRNRYAAEPKAKEFSSGNAQQPGNAQQQYPPTNFGSSLSSIPNNSISNNSASTQQVQPLLRAAADPPPAPAQSVTMPSQSGNTAPNFNPAPSQNAPPNVAANEEANKQGQGKATDSKSAEKSLGEMTADKKQESKKQESPSSVIGLDPTNSPTPQLNTNQLQQKAGKDTNGVVSDERATQNRGQAYRSKSDSAEGLNQQQAQPTKPSNEYYIQNQQQFNNQQFTAQSPQQQLNLQLNNQTNDRVRAVFIIQKKPTQEINPEPAKTILSK